MSKEVLRAQAGSLMLLDEPTKTLNFAVALGKKSRQLKKNFSLKLGQGIAGWVAEKGTPLVVPDVNKDKRFYSEPDNTINFTTKSILAVPLRVQNKTIGVLEVLNPLDKDGFSLDDIPMFEAFACQVAVAIENARMHKKILEQQKVENELSIAAKIQEHILPHKKLKTETFYVAAEYKSAKKIGGDFFDIIDSEDHIIVVIGDVAGKGIPAALYMVRLVTELRSLANIHKDISVLANKLNNILLHRSTLGMFATAIILNIDKTYKNISIINAGHPDPLLIKGKSINIINTQKGLPLGIVEKSNYSITNTTLNPNTSLLLYTDGILEARSKKKKEFGTNKLKVSVRKLFTSEEKEPLKKLFSEIHDFSKGAQQHDDLTAVLVKAN